MFAHSNRPTALERLVAATVLALGALTPRAADAQDPKPKKPATERREPVSKKPPAQRVVKAEDERAGDPPAENTDEPETADDDERPEESPPKPAGEVSKAAGEGQRLGGPHHVVALRGDKVVLDLTESDDVEVGDVVELWRPLRVTHPITGAELEDTIFVSKVRVTQIGSQLSLGERIGEPNEELEAGDRVVFGALEEKPDDQAADAPIAANVESAAVDAMWSSLRGATLTKRILTYEAFVRKYPSSVYAVPIWEEAQTLRELMHKRDDPNLTAAPPRPAGAKGLVATDDASAMNDQPSVNFDDLETRYLRLQRLRLVDGGISTPPPSADDETERRGVGVHDGGFVRLAFGPSWFNGAYEGNFRQSANAPNIPAEVDLSGGAFTAEFLGGGALVPGFILAARAAITIAPEPTMQFSELEDGFTDATLDPVAMPFVGMAMDVYPDPSLGVHFFGTFGMTFVELTGDDRVGNASFFGLGYGGGVGYEGFVSDEWSIGVQARIEAAHMFDDGPDASDGADEEIVTMVSPTLQMTFTYN